MKHKAHGLTDVGKTRKENEDFFLLDNDLGMYIVCDGLGGHAAGDVASQIACQAILEDLRNRQDVIARYAQDPSPDNRREAMSLCESAVQLACRAVYDSAREDEARSGMSTTCVLLVLAGPNALLAHVGDSRAYLIRNEKAWQMTEDHSYGLAQFRSGNITPDEVSKDIYSALMTRCLGHYPSVEVDILNIELMPNDRFILCSDGLSDYLTARTLTKVSSKLPVEEMPVELVQLANKKGGKDNITCIAVEVDDIPQPKNRLNAEEKIAALRQIPFFESLGFVELVKVLNILHMRRTIKDETVIREGEAGQMFYVIMDGAAEVRRGKKKIADLGPGDFFGEMGLIDNAPRSADVITTEQTSLLVIRREDFNSLMFDQLQLSQKVLWSFCQVLSSRLRETNKALEDD